MLRFLGHIQKKEATIPIITKIMITITVITVLVIASVSLSFIASSTAPTLNQGQKWRIGYYEGGPYINYPTNLKTIVAGLVKLGWMAPLEIPNFETSETSKPVWDYLVRHARSEYLEFVDGARWSAAWSQEKRAHIKDKILQRLNTQKDIDFMIAMGTWAGQDLANHKHHIPTMVVSVSDPIRSGISASAERSGLDHVHAKCDPNRYIRQVRLFHRFVKFKRLGVVHENSAEGRTYAALDDIYKVAGERGFSIDTCQAPISGDVQMDYTYNVLQCHRHLAEKVDAVYVTVHPGLVIDRMSELMKPLLSHRIPTWSQRGPEEVKAGVLFSVSRGGFKAVGQFYAEVMARVFNGEKPGRINQIFEDPKLFVVNKKVADMIDFDIPNSIMRIADEVYETIDE